MLEGFLMGDNINISSRNQRPQLGSMYIWKVSKLLNLLLLSLLLPYLVTNLVSSSLCRDTAPSKRQTKTRPSAEPMQIVSTVKTMHQNL